jgi:hypothetical protein
MFSAKLAGVARKLISRVTPNFPDAARICREYRQKSHSSKILGVWHTGCFIGAICKGRLSFSQESMRLQAFTALTVAKQRYFD